MHDHDPSNQKHGINSAALICCRCSVFVFAVELVVLLSFVHVWVLQDKHLRMLITSVTVFNWAERTVAAVENVCFS